MDYFSSASASSESRTSSLEDFYKQLVGKKYARKYERAVLGGAENVPKDPQMTAEEREALEKYFHPDTKEPTLKFTREEKNFPVKIKVPQKGGNIYTILGIRRIRSDELPIQLWINLGDVQAICESVLEITKDGRRLHQFSIFDDGADRFSKFSVWVLDDDYDDAGAEETIYETNVAAGMALFGGMCLSGGGYRATVFHLGGLRRLNELGFLSALDTFSSVSGGSITNAILATAWNKLTLYNFSDAAFEYFVREPVIRMVTQYDMITPGAFTQNINHLTQIATGYTRSTKTGADDLANRYIAAEKKVKSDIESDMSEKMVALRKLLRQQRQAILSKGGSRKIPEQPEDLKFEYGFDKSLAEALPHTNNINNENANAHDNKARYDRVPQFIFCGTDFRDGRPFYFTDESVGRLKQDYISDKSVSNDIPEDESKKLATKITLAQAVAASSSYPISFQPLVVPYGDSGKAIVTDGGLYDNLGLDPLLMPCRKTDSAESDVRSYELNSEPALKFYKRTPSQWGPHRFIFVSDGGHPLKVEDDLHIFPPVTALRTVDVMGDQVNKIKIRDIREQLRQGARNGSAWQLHDIRDFIEQSKSGVLSQRAEKNERVAQWLVELGQLAKLKKFPRIDDVLRKIEARKLLFIRTDLDSFSPAEAEVVEQIGYLLASHQLVETDINTILQVSSNIDLLGTPADGTIPNCHPLFQQIDIKFTQQVIKHADASFGMNKLYKWIQWAQKKFAPYLKLVPLLKYIPYFDSFLDIPIESKFEKGQLLVRTDFKGAEVKTGSVVTHNLHA